MTDGHDLLEVIEAIDPAQLDYSEWTAVGMALKDAGHHASDWDTWSQRDAARYRPGECFKKWETFRGSSTPVTGGTIIALARSHGWTPSVDEGYELDWDSVIGSHAEPVVISDTAWVEAEEVTEPTEWDPAGEIIRYLETLFESNENVGYVTTTWEKDDRHLPTKGNWDRSAGQLIQGLSKCDGDIGSVLGDINDEAGAWIRFNPLDGEGCKNDNVTEFRYALVESDTMSVGKQYAVIRELELPVATLVHSGGKSLHAVVRIDAPDYAEYRKRVDHLYAVCKRNGLEIDSQNKNPSRLSRMPGVTRNGHKQWLLATNIGRASWAEWNDWMEEVTDTLPVDITDFDQEWDEDLAPQAEIIEGILGQHEKMMISGPSKAGKSFSLLEMCAAFAEGGEWMGRRCTQGHVLYINLELKRESRIRRLKEVFRSSGYGTKNLHRIHSLDLRGLSAPLDQLASKIVRQAARYGCIAIIIDPIYKVMAGDENSAEHVAKFCNQLDSLSRKLGCSVIYCHHYSKGQQGQKSSMDRASGSGVFARDVDALIAMTELEVTDAARGAYFNDVACKAMSSWLDRDGVSRWGIKRSWRDDVSQDALVVEKDLRVACAAILPTEGMNALIAALDALQASIDGATAWRLEGTLREFAPLKPIDVWYRWPIHDRDRAGTLADAQIKDMVDPRKKGAKARSEKAAKARSNKHQALDDAVANANFGDAPTTAQAMTYMGLDPNDAADKKKFDRVFNRSGKYVRECQDKAANLWVIVPREVEDEDA